MPFNLGLNSLLYPDFVKVNPPDAAADKTSAEWLRVATEAAGDRTHVICAGGSSQDGKKFLAQLHEQLTVGGTAGNATGRNIHQRPLGEAVRFCHAIASLTYGGHNPEFAGRVYQGQARYTVD